MILVGSEAGWGGVLIIMGTAYLPNTPSNLKI